MGNSYYFDFMEKKKEFLVGKQTLCVVQKEIFSVFLFGRWQFFFVHTNQMFSDSFFFSLLKLSIET